MSDQFLETARRYEVALDEITRDAENTAAGLSRAEALSSPDVMEEAASDVEMRGERLLALGLQAVKQAAGMRATARAGRG